MSPLMLTFGFAFGFVAAYLGFLSYVSQFVLLALVFALGLAVCVAALVLDELSFNTYRFSDVLRLLGSSLLEFFGFRQFVTIASLAGLWAWAVGRPIRGKPAPPGWQLRPYDPKAGR